MAVLDEVRAVINDTGTVKRISDADLTILMADALDDVNAWANTTYTVAQLDIVPHPVPLRYTQLFFLAVKIKVIQRDIQNPEIYAKFVTQDVQYDPGTIQATLNKVLYNLNTELTDKIKKWIGTDIGAVVASAGDQLGGWKEF